MGRLRLSEAQQENIERNLIDLLDGALREDIQEGDLTVEALPLSGVPAIGKLICKQDGVLSGLMVVSNIFNVPFVEKQELFTGPAETYFEDGDAVEAGKVVADFEGDAAALLLVERSMLNLVTHMSGIATLTRNFCELVAHTEATICDTRKTLPGLRTAQKYAVRCGGGTNHRFGLYDEAMIKENHLKLSGLKVGDAIKAVRDGNGEEMRLTCEVESMKEFEAALGAAVDCILLDEFTLKDMTTAVKKRDDARRFDVLLEASGGVNIDTVKDVAETGVDRISVGALTHSAPSLDLSFKIFPKRPSFPG